MGQYQQWLRYQDIDKSLRKTRQALEEELAELEGQLDTAFFEELAQQEYLLESNPIISALFVTLQTPDASAVEQPYTEEAVFAAPSATPSSWRFADQPEIELLPEDMNSFLDEHTRTEPQIELPWWLRRITDGTGEQSSGPAPEQGGNHTNRLVQRWIERWGRQPGQPSTRENEEGDGE